MQIENQKQINTLLESISDKLDIPPGKYQEAVERYEAVGEWLDAEDSRLQQYSPRIFPQGSFRLGTVVRPWKDGKEAEYDIDLVCRLSADKNGSTPSALKQVIGDRIKEHGTYREMLDKEGRRCWTLLYAEKDGIGFHLDILPSLPEDRQTVSLLESQGIESSKAEKAIAITNKEKQIYEWKTSNPEGYADWFSERCRIVPNYHWLIRNAKAHIFNENKTIYASVDQVPDQLAKTPLQRVIQVLKRHRDVYFAGRTNESHKPISMIITTLAASFYDGEPDVVTALINIISIIVAHAALVEDKYHKVATAQFDNRRIIFRTNDQNGTWQIKNPVNSEENFADRWHEDGQAKARAFFEWVDSLSILFQSSSFNTDNELSDMLLRGKFPKADGSTSMPYIVIKEPAKPWSNYGNP